MQTSTGHRQGKDVISHRRRGHRSRQPYAWLAAGAVSVGVGAALAAGTGIASADAGGDGASAASSATGSAPGASTSTASSTTAKARSGTGQSRPRGDIPRRTARATPEAAIDTSGVLPASATDIGKRRLAATPAASVDTPAPAQLAAADSGWGDTSYLPDNEVIVPGSAVRLALQQIAAAQDALTTQTWGEGNILAGLASIVPQMFLAQASWTLNAWQDSIDGAKSNVADTVGVPVMHQLAQISLLGTLLLPTVAGVAFDVAAATVPLVGIFGAKDAAVTAGTLTDQAKTNGQVYAIRPMRTVSTTQQVVYISVNGGPQVPVQLDTGSSGLTILRRYIGQENLGPATGKGTLGYGSSADFAYTSYATTIDFGGGAVTSRGNIKVIDADSEAAYDNYSASEIGVAGTLGIAANSGDGPNANALLPGELRDGVLMFQNIIGPWGFIVLGPNPLPSFGSVSGTPVGNIQLQINDGTPQLLKTNVDSGGIYGRVPASLAGSAADGKKLKPGTQVTAYTADGKTKLFTYTIDATNSPTVFDDAAPDPPRNNTGNVPFQLGPIYVDYGTPDRLGMTYFDLF